MVWQEPLNLAEESQKKVGVEGKKARQCKMNTGTGVTEPQFSSKDD